MGEEGERRPSEKILTSFNSVQEAKPTERERSERALIYSVFVGRRPELFSQKRRRWTRGKSVSIPGINRTNEVAPMKRQKGISRLSVVDDISSRIAVGWAMGSPERIEQSRKTKAFLETVNGAKILCGDLNLLPHTQSLILLEQGMCNLVKAYGITSTRSHLYERPDRFADYVLASPEVQVKHFQVLDEVVSDHLPLLFVFQ
jgi:hypothetical protein